MQKASMNTDKDYPFNFDGSACEGCGGKCCVGESGYVFASIDEMQKIASFLALEFESFTKSYVRLDIDSHLLKNPIKTHWRVCFLTQILSNAVFMPIVQSNVALIHFGRHIRILIRTTCKPYAMSARVSS